MNSSMVSAPLSSGVVEHHCFSMLDVFEVVLGGKICASSPACRIASEELSSDSCAEGQAGSLVFGRR